MPWSCVRGAPGRFGVSGAGAGCRVFPVSPFPPRISCAVCGGPSRLGAASPRSPVRHSMRFLRSAGSVRLPFWFSPRVLCVCVRSRSRGVRPPSLPGLVWRAHPARSRCWALVGLFGAVRAPPRVLPRSRVPLGLLRGGAARSCFPLPDLGLRALRGVGAGVGRRHQPHRVRSCDLALRAVKAARGARGGLLLPGCGASGIRHSPTPDHSSFRACGRGPLPTGYGCGECRGGDPSLAP